MIRKHEGKLHREEDEYLYAWRLRVREAAEQRGFNQESLSTRTGIPSRTIGQAWKEYSDIHLSTLEKIAHALGVKLTDLLEDGPGGQKGLS
jgi:transcriptional regulator with XRE-family HTH domain